VDRAQSADRINWAVWGLVDGFRTENIDVGAFVVSKLKYYSQSYVEVLNLKLAVRDKLLQQSLRTTGIIPAYVTKLQEVLADFDSARAFITAFPGLTADTTWMAGMPESACCFLPVRQSRTWSTFRIGIPFQGRDQDKAAGR